MIYKDEEYKQRIEENSGKLFEITYVEKMGHTTILNTICKVCGDKTSKTVNHLIYRKGCRICSKKNAREKQILTQEKAKQRLFDMYGALYEIRSKYVSGLQPLTLLCNNCGDEFETTLNRTVSGGYGCPTCFPKSCVPKGLKKKGEKCNLYILLSEDHALLKVGISLNKIEIRKATMRNVWKKEFELYYSHNFECGEEALKAERFIKSMLRLKYHNPVDKFQGYTEIFVDVKPQDIINILDDMKKMQRISNCQFEFQF